MHEVSPPGISEDGGHDVEEEPQEEMQEEAEEDEEGEAEEDKEGEEAEEAEEDEEAEGEEEEAEVTEIQTIRKKKYHVGKTSQIAYTYVDDETMGEEVGIVKDGRVVPRA
jgi:hypothetical protein